MASYGRQHYIPVFLLKQWHSAPDDRLTQYRWLNGNLVMERKRAKYVGHASHTYSLLSKPQPDPYIERDYFGRLIDDPAAIIHRRLLQPGIRECSSAEASQWTRFIVSLMVRAPEIIAFGRSASARRISQYERMTAEEIAGIGGAGLDSELRRLARELSDTEKGDMLIKALPRVLETPIFVDAVNNKHWFVRDVSSVEIDLLIGDQPLCADDKLSACRMLYLPLSPNRIFFATSDPKRMKRIDAMSKRELVMAINRDTVSKASRYVWGTCGRHEPLVKKLLKAPSRPD